MSEAAAEKTTLDVTAEQIARTYAQAFLGAAGNDASAVEDLEAVHEQVIKAHPRFAEVMSSAFLDHEDRIAMIDRVLGGRVTPAVLNLFKVLSAHGRTEIAGEVARQARLLFDESAGRRPVLVRVASPIDDSLVSDIAATLRGKMGIDPVVSVEVVPELVGGVEIRVGDTVFDGTVKTAFEKAHKAIVDQTVEAIETQPQRFTVAG